MPAIKIRTDGQIEKVSVPKSDTLSWLYEQIGCSLVDVVRLPEGLDFWVDDEGLLNDSPPNMIASVFAMMFGGVQLETPLCGNVIVAGHDSQGNTIDLSYVEATAFIITLGIAIRHAVEMATGVPNMPGFSAN